MEFGSESAGFRGFRLWRWVVERADENAFVGARRHNRAELHRAVHAKVPKIVWEGGVMLLVQYGYSVARRRAITS